MRTNGSEDLKANAYQEPPVKNRNPYYDVTVFFIYSNIFLHEATATDRHSKAIIWIHLFSMSIKLGKIESYKPLIISDHHEGDIKRVSSKAEWDLKVTFSWTLFHAIYVELHKSHLSCVLSPQDVGWLRWMSPNACRLNKRNLWNALHLVWKKIGRAETAPCWICISFNRQLLWTHKDAFVKCCWSS